mmetsp:Transcript_26527/g.67486  ORF Transcript_26527/g.67486 Transcript_26527/m.67486 type:complete len:206 (+) Transcript_26527:894-1511(+)
MGVMTSGPCLILRSAATVAMQPAMVVTWGMSRPSACLRRSLPSVRSTWSPEAVSIIMQISPFFIRSRGLGRPSWILNTCSQGMPASRSALAVPPVATRPNPRLPRSRAMGMMADLYLSAMVRNTLPERGSFMPAAMAALAYAPAKSVSMPMTSPVERISGPSSVSQPGNLRKGSTTSLTDTWAGLGSAVNLRDSRVALPAMMRDA